MGEAAKISLKAIGKQDTFLLSKDPDESFFNYTTDRNHSNFDRTGSECGSDARPNRAVPRR